MTCARLVSRSILLGMVVASPAVAEPVLSRPTIVDTNARLINVSGPSQVVHKGEALRVNVLRATPGGCAEVKLTIDGRSRIAKNATFPWTLDIGPSDAIFPTKTGKYELAIDGVAGCTGHLGYVFAYNASDMGVITDFQMVGWPTPSTAAVVIQGHGQCMLRVATYNAPYTGGNQTPLDLIFNDWKPVRLPVTVPLKRSADVNAQFPGPQVVEIIMLGSKHGGAAEDKYKQAFPTFEGCVIQAAGASQSGLSVQRTWTPPKAAGASASSSGPGGNSGGGTPAGPGNAGGSSSPKPATGKITAMLVPGGSFAEDEAQKIQVNGTGGCGLDLTISNKSYGGSYEQTFPVLPRKLDGGATLYNGTDFGTLAEGSWKASAIGKNGCTGTATTDFKVTAKTSTKKIAGQPTISFDQPPKGGGDLFFASKDSNIWFKVTVPQAIKDEPYASCCDVEYDYMNEYGGWEPLPNSPFQDPSWGLAVKQAAGVANRSVSYFGQGTQWRVKVRAYKFKTQFDWSNWLQFRVDQH